MFSLFILSFRFCRLSVVQGKHEEGPWAYTRICHGMIKGDRRCRVRLVKYIVFNVLFIYSFFLFLLSVRRPGKTRERAQGERRGEERREKERAHGCHSRGGTRGALRYFEVVMCNVGPAVYRSACVQRCSGETRWRRCLSITVRKTLTTIGILL